ncbi:MAG TPA: glycoside hydrolase family 32 protein [Candidatus Acidoferrum sp.]|nr:glycoside hydrolase family 32 protein [Candidatus Acidoferrum sp.]
MPHLMKTADRLLRAVFAGGFLLICAIFVSGQRGYNEPWRPQFHFTPPKNFMNDPNGLVYYKGEYHLFYQYNPQGTEWGHMNWGHAVSADMLHWKNLPVAIPEAEGQYMIYSGSAVVDWHNASGLCQSADPGDPSCLIAVYTAAGANWQRQNLAFSNDRGRTWTNYPGNPIADLEQPDFRDPKVFWYDAQKKWVMVAVLADERKAVFFDTRDLKNWTQRGSFEIAGNDKGQWECPDLFELPVDGNPKNKKWVLIVNRNPGAPAGGTGTRYFVGTFDGEHFVNETPSTQELWADYGKDFYATNSYSDLPASDYRRIWIGWISNWQYANREPTAAWRGAQSLPRELSLSQFPDGIRLVQKPIAETKTLREREFLKLTNVSVPMAMQVMHLANVHGDTLEIEVELASKDAKEIGFRLRKGGSEETILGISSEKKELFVDRTHSGEVSFAPEFPGRHAASLRDSGRVKLHIFLDRSSLEVFVNDGELVMTERIYPSTGSDGIELFSDAGKGRVLSLTIWKLGSIWK